MGGVSVKVAAAVLLGFVFLLRGTDLVHAGGAVEISEGAAVNYLMASAEINSSGRGNAVGEHPKFPPSKRTARRLGDRKVPLPPSPKGNTHFTTLPQPHPHQRPRLPPPRPL